MNFHAQHAAAGAFFSFTCGHFGSRGGFGLQIGKPGNQNLYVGVKDGDRFSDAPLKCLPFYEGAVENGASAFQVEQSDPNQTTRVVPYAVDEITRHYGWGVDRWTAEDLSFAIYTDFGPIPDPSARHTGLPSQDDPLALRVLPAIVATLRLDNTRGRQPRTACFAIQFPEAGARMIRSGDGGVGFAWRSSYGVAVQAERDVGTTTSVRPFGFMRWTPDGGLRDANPIHALGNCPGAGVTVPAGEAVTLRLVLGVHVPGTATTGRNGSYWYTHYYPNLDSVLRTGLVHASGLIASAEAADARLANSGRSTDQQFMIAHATRSYYGSTQLLDVGGEPFWVVNEGEYCMLNTLDLAVDQVFWELEQNPWVVRNLLDRFVRHYSYVDRLQRGGEPVGPGGISFSHDMGVHNDFSPDGYSSYELSDLDAKCFSYMTCEQLCNWVLIAACYRHKTKDANWVEQNAHVIDACLSSLVNRGGDAGYVQYDSSRCGHGAEITTYDSLDHSLAQTRNNIYMAVKCWASYLGLANLLEVVRPDRAALAASAAGLVERNVLKQVQPDGVFPALFEPDSTGHASRILPAIEGLVYPWYWADVKPSPFMDALKTHTVTLLKDRQRRNVFEDGGIRLSSTSSNSWMSKIAIFMHVCRRVFELDGDPAIRDLFERADAAHATWQTEGESAAWACSDQFVNGVAKGSRYYPRIVTATLWLQR